MNILSLEVNSCLCETTFLLFSALKTAGSILYGDIPNALRASGASAQRKITADTPFSCPSWAPMMQTGNPPQILR